jgi:prolyl oligopeptidase PreP (S9A serine peptidase family)
LWATQIVSLTSSSTMLRASPMRVQQKFANEQDGTKRMFFVVAGRHAKVLKWWTFHI